MRPKIKICSWMLNTISGRGQLSHGSSNVRLTHVQPVQLCTKPSHRHTSSQQESLPPWCLLGSLWVLRSSPAAVVSPREAWRSQRKASLQEWHPSLAASSSESTSSGWLTRHQRSSAIQSRKLTTSASSTSALMKSPSFQPTRLLQASMRVLTRLSLPLISHMSSLEPTQSLSASSFTE